MPVEEMSEDELFNNAVSDETPDSPVVDEPEIEQPEPARDENGRFAKAEAEEEQPEVEQKPADDSAQIPSWRLREIREERDDLRRQLEEARRTPVVQPKAEPAPKAEKPDPLLDPDGYEQYLERRFEERLLNDRRENSLQAAAASNPEEFAEAYKAAQERVDPALKAMMQESRDPGKTLLTWHRENKVKQEIGTDHNAWLEKKIEERLNDPAFLAKAIERSRVVAQPQTNGRPRVELPPTLNGASRSNALLRSASSNDVSDEDLFNELTG